MTNAYHAEFDMTSALPDPGNDSQFYEGVRSRRAFAWIADTIATFFLASIAVVLFGVGTFGLGFFIAPWVAFGVAFIYRFGTIAGYSRTPGMALFGLEFRNSEGTRFDRIDALVHTALYTFIFFSMIGQLLTCLATLVTARKQTIADIITGSVAINRPL